MPPFLLPLPLPRLKRPAILFLLTAVRLFSAETLPAANRPSDWQDQSTLTTGWEFTRGDLGGIWETLRSDRRSLGLPVWTPVTLPHCVNATDAADPDTPYYQGPSWYRTQLQIANPFPGGRTLLQFEGSGQKTTVWIGDQKVADHRGGYDEFLIDITDAVEAYRKSPLPKLPAADYRVAPGHVPLAVRCDNSRDLEMIPSSLSDFNRYGGLYRPVHLVYLPAGGLTRVTTSPALQPDGTWRLDVAVRFLTGAGTPADETVIARVTDPDGREIARVDQRLKISSEVQSLAAITVKEPKLWSPGSPSLYAIEVTATGPDGTSQVRERFGLRSFEFVDHGPFKLNGARLLLRGTHRHEDQSGVAAAMTDEMMEKEMRLMKSMGVNFIRLGHYQQSRRILELCDELGILVWEEIPWCRGGVGGETYREQARAMLRAMIDQHRNHPSVILWGLGNEDDWPGDFPVTTKDQIRAFVRELNDLAHRLDPSRLTVLRRCDYCRDIVDVYSPSIWAGWYRGQFTEYQDVVRKETGRAKHILHAEWGGDSHAGRHAEDPYARLHEIKATGEADERGVDFMDGGGAARASRDGDWSETYLCDLIDWHLKEQEKMDWLTGSAMWVFKDFSTPLRPDNPVPYMNQKGAVERDLTPKESFYVYQSYWTDEPMVHIYGHSWPVRWGRPNEPRLVRVYSNCNEVELWLNGVSQGIKHRNSQDFPSAGLRWELPFTEGMNTLRAVGRRGGRTVTDEILFRYETRAWGKPDHLRLQAFPAPENHLRAEVELLDATGVVCLEASDWIRFGLAGDGRLIDNLGTVGGSRKVQLTNGRARIDVALPAGGRAVVSASVAGVPVGFLPLARPLESPPSAAGTAVTLEKLSADVISLDRERILARADSLMATPPVSIRSAPPPASAAATGVGPGDFYSMADYFWPNPRTPDGLPYINRDGETNPQNFETHRLLMRQMRDAVASFAAAYLVTHNPAYAQRAAAWLQVFFVDANTRMNPHLRFAQAVPGVATGRSYGIIDTLHLVEVPLAVDSIAGAPGVSADTIAGVRAWFGDYLHWLLTDPNGIKEGAAKNNHSVAYHLQVAVFARFTGNRAVLDETRRIYWDVLLPGQLAPDGSFPRELARTKPYGYSIFQLDNVALLTEVLSSPSENLWAFTLPDGRTVAQAMAFLHPFLADRSTWPFARDIAHFDGWPVRQPSLLLAGLRLNRPEYLDLWRRLPADSSDLEVRRNMAVTQPLLWLNRK
ncbi:MAG TPA: alginate lyase family protein [Candidatus Didemnitutus sp.]|nr:alginate lyase family protein [Candidatus Didemnitutus sp.]